MFQTAIHLLLQSFENEYLTSFMRVITAIGYIEFFMVFLVFIIFAVDFKKGFILLLILFWTGGVTVILKEHFNLPRPFHVDNRVQFLDGQLENESVFEFVDQGARTFWEPLPAATLSAIRDKGDFAHGFPSGHTSIAIALWGAVFLLFPNKWVRSLAVALMILIPFSRIYLGVHFIADVLGGLVIGAFALGICYRLVLRKQKLAHYLRQERMPATVNALSLFLLISPFVVLYFSPLKYLQLPGSLWGYGLAFLLVANSGFPLNGGSIGQKIGRMLIALLAYGVVHLGFGYVFDQMSWNENIPLLFVRFAIEGFAFLWVATCINLQLGWFERAGERP